MLLGVRNGIALHVKALRQYVREELLRETRRKLFAPMLTSVTPAGSKAPPSANLLSSESSASFASEGAASSEHRAEGPRERFGGAESRSGPVGVV